MKILGYATAATPRSAKYVKYETLEEFKTAHPRRKYYYEVCIETSGNYRMFSVKREVEK